MSENPFTIRVKIGDCELELCGSYKEVMLVFDKLPTITETVSTALKFINTSNEPSKQLSSKTDKEKLPVINAPANISCPEAITLILSTSWGRKQPRYFRDIINALKTNALHYPVGTVKGRLTDLTKKGVLRRIRSNRGYGYVLGR